MSTGEAIAHRLEYYMSERGITLYALSKSAGVPISTVQNLFRGHTKSPTVTVMFKLTQALGVSFDEFFDDPLFSPDNIELD